MATVNCTFSLNKILSSIPEGAERDRMEAWIDDWLGDGQAINSTVSPLDVPPDNFAIRSILSNWVAGDHDYDEAYEKLLLAGVSSMCVADLLEGRLKYDNKLWVRKTMFLE